MKKKKKKQSVVQWNSVNQDLDNIKSYFSRHDNSSFYGTNLCCYICLIHYIKPLAHKQKTQMIGEMDHPRLVPLI